LVTLSMYKVACQLASVAYKLLGRLMRVACRAFAFGAFGLLRAHCIALLVKTFDMSASLQTSSRESAFSRGGIQWPVGRDVSYEKQRPQYRADNRACAKRHGKHVVAIEFSGQDLRDDQ